MPTSPSKKGYDFSAIGNKIDRIKSNLIVKGKMSIHDSSSLEKINPYKVYSPLLYRNRPKIVFNNY